MKKKRSTTRARRTASTFSAADWRDIYDALMDAANVHHSGPRADRYVELAQKIREELIS